MQAVLQPNTVLQGGRYRVKEVLGQGGFGITYLGVQQGLERKVAIKEFFMKELCNRDSATSQVTIGTEGARDTVERFREKFLKEARSLAKLRHPHIVIVIDVFEENGTAYYVMEYAGSGSLASRVKRGGYLSEDEATRYVLEIADALGFIHKKMMNHLDVKPANIMLNDEMQTVLIDFGLSKQYDGSTGKQTSTTPVGISDGYAPMEQYNPYGVGEFSPQTDVYALGATFYYLLTGIKPPNASVVNEYGVPVEHLKAKKVSGRAIGVIEKSMQSKRRNRYSTMDEFVSALSDEIVVEVVDDDSNSMTRRLDNEEVARKARIEAERMAREEAERKAREEAERKAREEAERKAREEAERKAREEAERKAREEAERKAREESERKAREEAERQAREEAERKAREEAERKAREEAERKAREEAERKAREEAERKAREEAERKAREAAERKAREEAARKAREEAARKAREASERKNPEAERRAREEAERKAREVAARKAKQEVERYNRESENEVVQPVPPTPKPSQDDKRSNKLLVASLIVGLAALGGAAYYYYQTQPDLIDTPQIETTSTNADSNEEAATQKPDETSSDANLEKDVENLSVSLNHGHKTKRLYTYTGHLVNGVASGQGHAVYPAYEDCSSATFDGTFENGIPKNGKLTFTSKVVYDGTFDAEGGYLNGTLRNPDGAYFKGDFQDGNPFNGTWYTADNAVLCQIVNGEAPAEPAAD